MLQGEGVGALDRRKDVCSPGPDGRVSQQRGRLPRGHADPRRVGGVGVSRVKPRAGYVVSVSDIRGCHAFPRRESRVSMLRHPAHMPTPTCGG